MLLVILSLIVFEANRFSEEDIPYILTYLVITISAYTFAYIYHSKRIKKAKKKRGLREKLIEYRKVLFISWLIIIATVLYSLISYVITREHFFICSAIFSMAILLLNTPNLKNLKISLDLAQDEQKIVENPKSAI